MDTAQTTEVEPRGELVLDRYRLLRRLGAGGFGTVWLAHDERLDRPVAVKKVPLEGGESPRAEREARSAARLAHPGIVALYEAGRDDEAYYLVSELVRGSTLGELEREGALSDRDVVRIGAALCDALDHAHARGVIHRDVKPANVMVAEDGGGPKLTDFGIARLADAAALTRTGDVIGTIAYMAPEQAEGRRVTGAADLYALALVLYEALSGTNPVRAEGAAATARRVGMRIPPLRRLRRDLPAALCEALDAALDPDPEQRGSVGELRAALAAAEREVDDEPGVVEAGTMETFVDRTRVWRERRDDRAEQRAWVGDGDGWSDAAAAERRDLEMAERSGVAPADRRAIEGHRPRVEPATLPGRILAGLAAGALAGWALHNLPVDLTAGGSFSEVDPFLAAVAVGGAVALLPRLAWLVALAALLAGLGAEPVTVVVAAAVVPVILLVPRQGTLWSLPAAGAALDALGLAGVYPALAGEARTLPARAALGALGFWWLTLAAIVTDPHPDWDAVAEPGVLAVAALWGVAAAVLPLVVRGRRLPVDVVAATVWAAGLAAATGAIAEALAFAEPDGTVPAAVLAGIAAVAAAAFRAANDPVE
ncbi:MAG TPA: serine/threonine-protein kinase [Solirubrobacteraceae bacterium]